MRKTLKIPANQTTGTQCQTLDLCIIQQNKWIPQMFINYSVARLLTTMQRNIENFEFIQLSK